MIVFPSARTGRETPGIVPPYGRVCGRRALRLTIFNCGSYWRGVRSSLGLARKPSRRPGWYCIRRSRVLTSTVSWLMSCLARLASDRLRLDQTGSTGFSGRVRREPVDGQPVPGRDQLAHRMADVGVQAVSHAMQLLVRGVQEPGVVRLLDAAH